MEKATRIHKANSLVDEFFIQANKNFQNEEITFEIAGVIGYLTSLPGNWKINPSNLQRKGTGENKSYKIIRQLIDLGFLRRVDDRRDDGTLIETYYEFFALREQNPDYSPASEEREAPKQDDENHEPDVQLDENQDDDNHHDDNQDDDFEGLQKKESIKDTESENKDSTNIKNSFSSANEIPLDDNEEEKIPETASVQEMKNSGDSETPKQKESREFLESLPQHSLNIWQEIMRRALSENPNQLMKPGGTVQKYIKFVQGTHKAEDKGTGAETLKHQCDIPMSELEFVVFVLWYRKTYNQTKLLRTYSKLRERIDEFRDMPEETYELFREMAKRKIKAIVEEHAPKQEPVVYELRDDIPEEFWTGELLEGMMQ